MFQVSERLGERRVSTFYRVTAFGKPRGPWRATLPSARRDAVEAGLGAFDEDQRFFLDGIADIETAHENELIRSGAVYPGSYRKIHGQVRLSVRLQA